MADWYSDVIENESLPGSGFAPGAAVNRLSSLSLTFYHYQEDDSAPDGWTIHRRRNVLGRVLDRLRQKKGTGQVRFNFQNLAR